MGNFFTNLHVRTDDAARVAECLTDLIGSTTAWVTEPSGGWVSAYPEATEAQDDEVIDGLVRDVSRALDAPVVAFLVHDDDLLQVRVARRGRIEDFYDSAPDYFGDVTDEERQRTAGRPALLASLSTTSASERDLARALRRDADDLAHGSERAEVVARLLGIDVRRAVAGWNYLREDEVRRELEPLREIPSRVVEARARKRGRENRAWSARIVRREQDPALVMLHEPRGRKGPRALADLEQWQSLGFDALGCLWMARRSPTAPPLLHAVDPATGEGVHCMDVPNGWVLGPRGGRHVVVVAHDPSRVLVFDVETGGLRHEHEIRGPVSGAHLSADLRHVVAQVVSARQRGPFTVLGGASLVVRALDGSTTLEAPSGPDLDAGFKLAFTPDGRTAALGSRSMPGDTIRFRNSACLEVLGELRVTGLPADPHGERRLLAAAFPRDSSRFFVGTSAGVFSVRADDGRVAAALDLPLEAEERATATEGFVRMLERKGGRAFTLPAPDAAPLRSMAALVVGPGDAWLGATGIDGMLRFWSLPDLAPVSRHPTLEAQPRSLEPSPDGGLVALGVEAGAVQVWRTPAPPG